jgi:hypothetical protein
VATTGAKRRVTRSAIASVGSTIDRLPERLWENQIPRWGRPFLVPIPQGLEVVAGERVEIRFQ